MKTDDKYPDPFGRLMEDDGSQNKFKNMENLTSLDGAIGPTAENDPDDVAKVELLMSKLGELNLQDTDGPTGYYGERLRQAIVSYQRKNQIPQSGAIVPNDPTMVAISNAVATLQPTPDNRHAGGPDDASVVPLAPITRAITPSP
jgi:peptidoglycan hydrolase-like protein with peptidoglycan-binding domain